MKILIVDDDVALLSVIQKQVGWQELGIDRVVTAQNGEAAKAVIAREHPDIILSDISMPLCSGIDLIRYVHEREIPCEFAFLTCYAEMSYMREAMRYGAKWYLTKPVNFTELEQELQEITEVVRRKKKRFRSQPPEDHLIAITILRGLKDGLYGEDERLLASALESHGLSLRPSDVTRMIGIRINFSQPENTEAQEEEQKNDRVYIRPLTLLARQEILGFDTLEYTIIDPEETKLLLTLFVIGERRSGEELLAGCRSFIRSCKQQFGFSPVCVVGEEGTLVRTFSLAEGMKEELHRLRFQEGRAFSQGESERQAALAAGPEVSEDKLLQFFTQGNKPDFLRHLSGCISQGTRGRSDSDAFMMRLHHSLLQACFHCIRDNGFSYEDVFLEERLRTADQTAEHSGFEMLRFGDLLFERVNSLLREKNLAGDAVERAKQYIQKHYAENIDREEIAKAACVAPNYLSRLFHEKSGTSLREYINNMRMEEAKRLLLTTTKTIGEVAGEVGFDNISYFSTVFRKIVGVSPAEWKNSLQN